jgi:hypothetical protein
MVAFRARSAELVGEQMAKPACRGRFLFVFDRDSLSSKGGELSWKSLFATFVFR